MPLRRLFVLFSFARRTKPNSIFACDGIPAELPSRNSM
jgi:hypothetical protein